MHREIFINTLTDLFIDYLYNMGVIFNAKSKKLSIFEIITKYYKKL